MSNNIDDYSGNNIAVWLSKIKPQTLSCKDFPFSRQKTDDVGAFYIEHNNYEYERYPKYYTFDGKGFKYDFECARNGAIPLWDMKFLQIGYLFKNIFCWINKQKRL